MRSEQGIMSLILDTAQKDERIRAVYMNGSRTNSNTIKDIFQDYDVVYVVNEISSFIKDEKWVNQFGNLLMIQELEKVERLTTIEMNSDKSYGFLMLFKDGNRIDLHLETKESMLDRYGKDKLTIPLLDKENCLPQISAPTDIDYHLTAPMDKSRGFQKTIGLHEPYSRPGVQNTFVLSAFFGFLFSFYSWCRLDFPDQHPNGRFASEARS